MAEQTVMVPMQPLGAVLRQAGLLVGVAAAVAIGVWVVLWARTPAYSLLYANLSERDVGQVMQVLQASNIPHKIDEVSGSIMVAGEQVHDARLKLAAAGLPKTASMGFEMLDREQGFGTSKFIENARYQRALESELGRTIGQLANVRAVRVHLAIPKDSVFLRTRHSASASVLLDLYSGRQLEERQIGAIVHLVSASVPELQPDNVTIVDQNGRLLTDRYGSGDLAVSAERFDYTGRIERSYAERIEEILAPIVGADGVKAQVTAELDFTAVEQTSERFNPDLPAVRSEQTLEEQRAGGSPGGVPGALSNQPPGEASAPEVVAAGADAPGTAESAAARNSRRETTRNFELDKTISYTKLPVGSVRRLSAAVVVNHKAIADAAGKVTYQPLDEQEIARLTSLVKEAIGFSVARGDTVNVISAEFQLPAAAEPLPEPALWERPWVWSIGKQLLGILIALSIAFGVLRPLMKSLMQHREPALAMSGALAGPGGLAALPPGAAGREYADANAAAARLAADKQLNIAALGNDNINLVRSYVAQEPKLAAQVVKSWVSDE
ncbi:MAG: flagellar M-ring protein FliF [Gammaproteobacteria bacterium]|nr:flagellar M-ring protein FliF [Gammaproteobacteria bacterium]